MDFEKLEDSLREFSKGAKEMKGECNMCDGNCTGNGSCRNSEHEDQFNISEDDFLVDDFEGVLLESTPELGNTLKGLAAVAKAAASISVYDDSWEAVLDRTREKILDILEEI